MQTQVWSGTNWPLIVGLIFGSVALALLGDVLGFKYGKQRISVFGLRPRYTSVLRSEERRVGKECRSRWSPYH